MSPEPDRLASMDAIQVELRRIVDDVQNLEIRMRGIAVALLENRAKSAAVVQALARISDLEETRRWITDLHDSLL